MNLTSHFVIEYSVPYQRVVRIGVEADSPDKAIEHVARLLDSDSKPDDDPSVQLLYDDYEAMDEASPLEFNVIADLDQQAALDSARALVAAMDQQAALDSARALVAAMDQQAALDSARALVAAMEYSSTSAARSDGLRKAYLLALSATKND